MKCVLLDRSLSVRLCSAAIVVVLVSSIPALHAITPDASIPRLQAAADKGYIPQQLELAAAYFTGHGVPQDARLAAHWYEKAAESGDPEAENEIGYLYQTGTGVAANPGRALHWYQLSAASGFIKARVNIGVLHFWGLGVPKDQAYAAQIFREAVEKGSGAAASYLGDMCYFGMGIAQDKIAAEKWYETGAKLKDPVASYNLASLFSVTADHPHDLPRAAGLLRTSAAAGYVQAMHSLGLLLINHGELAKSSDEAQLLLETASGAGSWRSTIVLGALARDGKGRNPGPESAYYDFQLAELQGGESAKRLLANDVKALSSRLSAEQTGAIAANANEWFRQHPLALSFVYKKGEASTQFPAFARTAVDQDVHAGQLVFPPPA